MASRGPAAPRSEGDVRAAADALLALAEVTGPPAPLELLASLRGVVNVEAMSMRSAGRLVPRVDGYLIQVNDGDPPTRRRFSIAHEICHTFFTVPATGGAPHEDATTGAFDESLQEEYLCDVGAAHLLLHPRWLIERAAGVDPSIDRLFAIASECEASAEATARQLAALGVWSCSFVFWEPGYRKAEVRRDQPARLRVARVYASPGAPFLPRRKSVRDDSSIADALRDHSRTSGVERFVIGRRELVAQCESHFAGYDGPDGTSVPRVRSLLLWDRQQP